MKIRIIQWNISITSNPELICKYLESKIISDTIICLQEVSEKAFNTIKATLKPTSSVFSLNLRIPGKNEGKNRRMGVATLSFGPKIKSSDLLHRSVFPERTLFTKFKIKNKQISVLNFHSLTGVGYKKAKSSNFASIADFFESNIIDFACFDANEPKVDSMISSKIEFWDNGDKGHNAGLILGEHKVHNLSDSYIIYLNKLGKAFRKNPLTLSHKTNGTPRRYDYILNSPNWKPESIIYPYKESIKASSDHSAVIADF